MLTVLLTYVANLDRWSGRFQGPRMDCLGLFTCYVIIEW